METPYIKSLREQYAAAMKKAIAKENAKLNTLYKNLSLSIFNEAQNNEELNNIIKSSPKINESFQKLVAIFNETTPKNTKSNIKDKE
ncbi:Uncharacterised protein [Helicobacter fennelliae]|nr:Uncharacterised protein [Helicobacter fennelliae]